MKSQFILCLLVAFSATFSVNAQTVFESFFVNSKSRLLDMLPKNSRLDLLDYYNSGMKAMADNVFDGKSTLSHKSDSKMVIALSAASHLELHQCIASSGDTLYVFLHQIDSPVGNFNVEVRCATDSLLSSDLKLPLIEDFVSGQGVSRGELDELEACGVVAKFDASLMQLDVALAVDKLPDSFKLSPVVFTYGLQGAQFVMEKGNLSATKE